MALNLMSLNSCFIIAMTGIFIFWLGIGADLSVGLLPDRHYQRGVWHRHLAGAGALPGAVNGFCVMRLKIHPMVATIISCFQRDKTYFGRDNYSIGGNEGLLV